MTFLSRIVKKHHLDLMPKQQFENELTKERKHQREIAARLDILDLNLEILSRRVRKVSNDN